MTKLVLEEIVGCNNFRNYWLVNLRCHWCNTIHLRDNWFTNVRGHWLSYTTTKSSTNYIIPQELKSVYIVGVKSKEKEIYTYEGE